MKSFLSTSHRGYFSNAIMIGLSSSLLFGCTPHLSGDSSKTNPSVQGTVSGVKKLDSNVMSGTNSTLMPQNSGKCVDVPNNSSDVPLALGQWDCNGGPQQNYQFNTQGDGSYQIQTSNGLCLDSMGNQGPVSQYPCNSGANQSWNLQSQGNNIFVIQNSGNYACFNIAGNSSDNGAQLYTYDCDSSQANERFAINLAAPQIDNPPPPPPNLPPPPSYGGTLVGVAPMNIDQYNHERGVQSFESFLGRRIDFAVDFLDDTSWGGLISDTNYGTDGWLNLNSNRQVMWSVPLTVGPHGCGGCGTPLSDVAAGYRDDEFRQVANTISQKQPYAFIRIGWEFNTNDYPWSVNGGHEQDYINAFRHVVQIFRSANPNFRFVWCPLILSRDEGNVENAYPGDDAVDIVGVDYYDDNWGSAGQRWDYTLTGTNGLQWQVDFAGAHGKQLSVPEWGAGKQGDSPDFIHRMGAWFRDHNYASQSYWEGYDGSGYNSYLEDYQFSQQSQAYREEFDH